MVQFINIILIACIRFFNLHDYPNFVKIIFTTLCSNYSPSSTFIYSLLSAVFPLQCWFSRYGITVPAIKSEKKKKENGVIMQTNKSLAVKIRDTVFGETLKSSVEERDESRQNKLETVKLTAPLPPPSLRVVLIFVYRSIYRCVKFTPPVLSADVRAETEMAVMHARKPALNSWCARTGRTTN